MFTHYRSAAHTIYTKLNAFEALSFVHHIHVCDSLSGNLVDEASDIEQAMGQYAGLYRPQSNYGDNGVEAREQAGARRTNSVHAGNVIQQRQNMAAFRPESVYGDLFSNATGCATTGVWNSLTVQGISNYPPGTDF